LLSTVTQRTIAPLVRQLPESISLHAVAPAFAHLPGLALLESSQPGALGRYSYLTADPFLRVESTGDVIDIKWSQQPHRSTVRRGQPFAVLRELLAEFAVSPATHGPPFQGGAVGAFAYDLGRQLEELPSTAPCDVPTPELSLGFYDWVLAHDHQDDRSWLITNGLPEGTVEAAAARQTEVLNILAGWQQRPMGHVTPSEPFSLTTPLEANLTREQYVDMVLRAQAYIAAGDTYQVNLSQRLSAGWKGSPWGLYERLRRESPVPFGAYLDLGNSWVVSASPERFLHVRAGVVETRPIKGTRPRGATAAEDAALAEALRTSVKDRAENLMIVDLLRNDLGKVCRVGTVRVPALWQLEAYSNVWQLVSEVTGELRPDVDAVAALEAAFPGGSVTGCPKIRAMEIIEELEPVRRGIYCGAIGYIGFDGAMDTSIVIRTVVLTRDRLHLQVGGAVVADSDPQAEYEETLVKAQAARQVLEGRYT
jgi:para-aminobenzoate synthetase component 1